ncbi:PREDICTED: interferon-induced 35 kDa protein [Tinamus guttatus]|uniref:interferon-induced 35 kDa protein n=1 Tax=Tinamus guttatus TaxID=94827 RepID=UPI00052EA578|nr:PREDICTED: interferon-induced 35 kDa protein [Tinamus guttatus]
MGRTRPLVSDHLAQELCVALEHDCAELQAAKEDTEQKALELWKERERLRMHPERQICLNREHAASHQESIYSAKEERSRLIQEKELLKKKLQEMQQRGPAEDLAVPALPERSMVFRGQVTDVADTGMLTLTPRVHYPLLGGSALITFEQSEVAQRIVAMKEHVVELSHSEEPDRCRMHVRAEPVELLLPSALEVGLSRSCQQVLLSGLSGLSSLGIPEDTLLDKLELFFSKAKNGGGEVESLEFLCSDQVVLSFAQDGVAEKLVARGLIQFPIKKTECEIKISPYVSGDVTSLKLRPSRCARTVLLRGIPDVLDTELMRDTLEIHFQRSSRGGGEVDALGYVPEGQWAVAIFEEDVE